MVIFVTNSNKYSPDTSKIEQEMQKGNESHVSLQNKTFSEKSEEKKKFFDELRNAVLEQNVSKIRKNSINCITYILCFWENLIFSRKFVHKFSSIYRLPCLLMR